MSIQMLVPAFDKVSVNLKRARRDVYDECHNMCHTASEPLNKIPRDHLSQDISDAKNRFKTHHLLLS